MTFKKIIISKYNMQQMALLDKDNTVLKLKYEQENNNINDIYLAKVIKYLDSINAYFIEFYNGNGEKKNGFIKGNNVFFGYTYNICYSQIFKKINKFNKTPILNHYSQNKYRKIANNSFVIAQAVKDGSTMKKDSFSTFIVLSYKYLTVKFFEEPCVGISRQLKGEIRFILRNNITELLKELGFKSGLHIVVKNTAQNTTYDDLKQDLLYIIKLWNTIINKISNIDNRYHKIYQHFDFLENIVLNVSWFEVNAIITDDFDVYKNLKKIMKKHFNQFIDRLEFFQKPQSLIDCFNLNSTINSIFSNKVYFLERAYLIIDKTEACTVIDVNSGNVKISNTDKHALYINQHAIPLIIQQIVVRNISGLITIDFIEMKKEHDRAIIEKEIALQIKNYDLDVEVSKMNDFCISVISKKRKHMSTDELFFDACGHCRGRGVVTNILYEMYSVLSHIEKQLYNNNKNKMVYIKLSEKIISNLLLNHDKKIKLLEKKYNKKITFQIT